MAENAEEQLKAQMLAQGMDLKSDSSWYKIGVTQQDPNLKLFAFQRAIKMSKKNSDAWNGIGLLVTDPKEKEEAFRNAIKADSKFAEAWLNLGRILEDPKEKQKAFQTAINVDQKCGNAYVELIKLSKDEKQKTALLNTAMQFDPENENVYIALSDVFPETSDKIQILRKGLQNCPPSERLWLKLATTIPDEAGQFQPYKKVLEFNIRNLQAWEQILRRTVHNPDVKQWVIDFAQKLQPEVRSELLPALKNVLSSPAFRKFIDEAFTPKEQPEMQGLKAQKQGSRTKQEIEAILLKKMGDLGFPSYIGRSWINLAQILPDDEEKIAALEKGLGIEPAIGEGWTMLGYAYQDPEKKKLAFQRAIGLNPQDVKAWKGVAKTVTSDQEKVFCYQRVLEADPADQESKIALAKLGIMVAGFQPPSPEPIPTPSPQSSPSTTPDIFPGQESFSARKKEDESGPFERKPIDTSDLQIKELQEVIRAEHKAYMEELADNLKTTPRNLKAFFQDLVQEGKIKGEFSVSGASFNFEKRAEKESVFNLLKALDVERKNAEKYRQKEMKRRELEKLDASVLKNVKEEVDNYDTRKESKSVPYSGKRFDPATGIAFIEGDPQQPYHTSLSEPCPHCHRRLFKYDTFCRWCAQKIVEKVLVRSATGIALPNTPEVPQNVLEKQGIIDEIEELALEEYSVVILIEAEEIRERDLFNNLDITVPGLLFYEKVNPKAMQSFYKKNGWDAEMPEFPNDKGDFWLFVVGMAIGKKDFVDGFGRHLEAISGVKVLRFDFLNSDALQIHELRMKHRQQR